MTPHDSGNFQELDRLIDGACDRTLTSAEWGDLSRRLVDDSEARDRYMACMNLHGMLALQTMPGARLSVAEFQRFAEAESDAGETQFDVPAPPSYLVFPDVAVRSQGWSLSSGWAMAYLIATVVFVIGLAIGAVVHVSQPGQFVGPGHSLEAPNPQSPIQNPSSIVARITGMVDCEWEGSGVRVPGSDAANQKSEIGNHKSSLHLGDRLALRSGLLELTYDTGAKVILQGPVTYKVESASGGYLSLGKLTARLEEKSEVRGQKSEVRDQRSASTNQKSEILNRTFAVRTPTALVTDLGTEFAVEVNRSGDTTSHVFRGAVKLQAISKGATRASSEQVLHANESAEVVRGTISRRQPPDRNRFPRFSRSQPRALVAFYPFDGDTNDAGGNHVSPTKVEDVTFVPGVDGQAARFDAHANSRIDLPVDVRPAVMPKLTWGAWVRPRTIGPVNAELFSTDMQGYGRTLTIDHRVGKEEQPSGAFRFAAFLGDQGVDCGVFPSSGPIPTPGTWTFVAAVHDDAAHRVRLFVEDKRLHEQRGGLVEDRMIGAQFGRSHGFVRIGRRADFGSNIIEPFDGEIDNVFIFREALQSRELEWIRRHGRAGVLAVAKGEVPPAETETTGSD